MRSRTGRLKLALERLGARRWAAISNPAASCVWHVVGLRRSVREWALRQGWGWAAAGILIAALGVLAAHGGYGEARRVS